MDAYQERLHRAIPGGAHTYSRGDDQFPPQSPSILMRGQGCYVFDDRGKRFLDYGMGLRSVTIGYADSEVNAAAFKQIENGNNLTRPSITELEAAELLIDLIPSVEMVKFAKNGSNVTSAAFKLARAFTGRSKICVPRQHPFFSFDDWFIASTPMSRGSETAQKLALAFDFGDITSLRKLFDQHPNEIAAVIAEPSTSLTPCPTECSRELCVDSCAEVCPNQSRNFLQQVQSLCREHGAVFILDEMITGFRWALPGAANYFGVSPDLITFGKAMANGFSLAALGGRREIMELGGILQPGSERVFLLSSTHGAEMSSLGAFMKVVDIYRSSPVIEHLWSYGSRLKNEANNIFRTHGLSDFVKVAGPPICLETRCTDSQGAVDWSLRTLFVQEMARRSILMPWISISFAHRDRELDQTLEAISETCSTMVNALDEGIQEHLEGPNLQPVFRKFN